MRASTANKTKLSAQHGEFNLEPRNVKGRISSYQSTIGQIHTTTNCNNCSSIFQVSMSKNQAEICKTFFKLLENERDTWLCKCDRKLKQRKGTGWSNLYAHIKVQHQQKSETVVNNLPDQPT